MIPRCYEKGSTYHVSRRCKDGICFLSPNREAINEAMVFTLAVAAQRTKVQIHSFMIMENHMHYVATDPQGQMGKFLQEYHRLSAYAVKGIRHVEGCIWENEKASVTFLPDRRAILQAMAYGYLNPQKAGMVGNWRDWFGARSEPEQCGNAYIKVNRPSCFSPKGVFRNQKTITLRLVTPPGYSRDKKKRFMKEINEVLEASLKKLEQEEEDDGIVHEPCNFLRVEKRASLNWQEIKRKKASCRPSAGRRRYWDPATWERHCDFQEAYKMALARWRSGNRDVVFPSGTYWLRLFHRAFCDEKRVFY